MNFFLNIVSSLDGFEIRNLLNINAPVFGNLSLTNIGLYLTIGGYLVTVLGLLYGVVSLAMDRIHRPGFVQKHADTWVYNYRQRTPELAMARVASSSRIDSEYVTGDNISYFLYDRNNIWGQTLGCPAAACLVRGSYRWAFMIVPNQGTFRGLVLRGVAVTDHGYHATIAHNRTLFLALETLNGPYRSDLGILREVQATGNQIFPASTPVRLGNISLNSYALSFHNDRVVRALSS